jgi:hypothetical protein
MNSYGKKFMELNPIVRDLSTKYTGSYFGLISIRQGMRLIQIFMLVVSLADIIPSISEVGYRCEISYADASQSLSSFSQVLCWIKASLNPWDVCKYSSLATFTSEFIDQIALFFGIVLISSPKPHIPYVKITRYLIFLSATESLVRLVYHALVYFGGNDFVSSTNSCAILQGYEDTSDDQYFKFDSIREMVYESLSLMFYSAYIYGTYALVTILKRGGTGDEKVIEEDVLSLVKVSPPKIVVLSSAFGITSLRIGIIALCCLLFGTSTLSLSRLVYRLIYTCGNFDTDSTWCIWPYGVMATIDEGAVVITCIITIVTYLNLKNRTLLWMLKFSWGFFVASSLGFLGMALMIITNNYPSYWMDNMKSDLWTYYIRFWISLVLVVLTFSVQVVRLAGGVGWENEKMASKLVIENLSEEVVENPRDSIDDLLQTAQKGVAYIDSDQSSADD